MLPNSQPDLNQLSENGGHFAVSVKRFARSFDIGLTKAWGLIKEREVDVIHLNGRTLVTTDSMRRMIQRKLAAQQAA